MKSNHTVTPLVSVIIPTFNQASYLAKAIRSVLEQSYDTFELIIIDNYSEDRTESVVRSFTDPRVRYVQFRNYGVIAASRNHGIMLAKGEFVAFLDSDDEWTPEKLSAQIELIQTDPMLGLVFSPFKIVGNDPVTNGRVIGSPAKIPPTYLYEKLTLYNFIASSSVMARTSVLKKMGGFDENPRLRCIEDGDLWLRIAREYKIGGTGQIMGFYRVHTSNQSGDEHRLARAFTVLEKHRKSGWITDELFAKAKSHYSLREAWNYAEKNGLRSRILFSEALEQGRMHNTAKFTIAAYIGIGLTFAPVLTYIVKKYSFDKYFGKFLLY